MNRVTLILTIPGHMKHTIRTVDQLVHSVQRDFQHATIEQIQIYEVYEASKTPGLSDSAIAGDG